MLEILELVCAVLMVLVIMAVIYLVYSVHSVKEEKQKMMSVPCYLDRPKTDDCAEATRMMVDFIRDGIDKGRRYEECSLAGCDGANVLRESRDIANLVRAVHACGCRLVLRRVSGHDLECMENTSDEVNERLSDMDIMRADRIGRQHG